MYDGRLYTGGNPNFNEASGSYTSPQPMQQQPVQNPAPQFAQAGSIANTPVQSPPIPIMAPPSDGGPNVGPSAVPPIVPGGNAGFQEFHGPPQQMPSIGQTSQWGNPPSGLQFGQHQHPQMFTPQVPHGNFQFPSISQFQMPQQNQFAQPMQNAQIPSIRNWMQR